MKTPAPISASVIPPLPIPDRIRAIRFFSGLNQTELAKTLDCSQGTISKLENGELEPTAFHLIRMREAFGVSIDAIVDGLIPYRSIAERFQNSSLLPVGYARGAGTKVKFLYPLICAFEHRYGNKRLLESLQRLGIKPQVFAEPELLVSAQVFHDLVKSYRDSGTDDAKEFLADVQNSVSEIQASLPASACSAEEWSQPDKWNIHHSGIADSLWGARPYVSAVVKGFRTGPSISSFKRARA